MNVDPKEQEKVDAWNEAYPVGQKVTVKLDSGEILETTTRILPRY